jgi:hypothetical protein
VTLGLDHQLTQRKLRRIRAVYGQGITQAEQQQLGYAEFLDELLSAEVLGRQEKQIRRTLQAAGCPSTPRSSSSTAPCAPSASARCWCASSTRLLRHSEVFYRRGSSFRRRGKEGSTTTGTLSSAAETPA